jgi:hypothetical protein
MTHRKQQISKLSVRHALYQAILNVAQRVNYNKCQFSEFIAIRAREDDKWM